VPSAVIVIVEPAGIVVVASPLEPGFVYVNVHMVPESTPGLGHGVPEAVVAAADATTPPVAAATAASAAPIWRGIRVW
jgi:hypothetical protein